MKKEENNSEGCGKKFAAVCGLYCRACSWFIATAEEPERLKRLAAELNYSEGESKCCGCRSNNKLPYCDNCKMFACAAERGIDFCSDCDEFPCDDLKQFQAGMPHRVELLDNLERIKSVGYKQWLSEIRKNYTCPQCKTINSTYDRKCRNCDGEPSCTYVVRHKLVIEQYFRKKKTV